MDLLLTSCGQRSKNPTSLNNAMYGGSLMDTVPMGCATTPQDVGNVCAFLCSDEASFLTGTEIPVDGGRCV